MLSVGGATDERIGTAHRAKLAFIYIRQSTADQVRQHQESTTAQYRLVDRAAGLGWPRERITVIDDDLGKSGTSSAERQGFQRLMAEIGLGKAGLVVSLDASRLARNNRDWHQLLELCSIFGVLLADSERLYDPGAYHDRLLLGLSGIMSEAELHQIRMRLHQGEWQKAARGELRCPLPAGLVWERDGRIALHPDEEVQARLRFVFEMFGELQSAKAVMRELQRHGLLLPARPLRGPSPQEVVWVAADSARVLHILHNPAYAGAYVYGRRRRDPTRRRTPFGRGATVKVALERWPICLRDAHPGYIGWEEFVANQARLTGNVAHHVAGRPGVVRRGQALLQGIVVCGRCGRRMGVQYSGPHGDYPVYHCSADQVGAGQIRCQEVRALAVDAACERILLETLTPERVALAVSAVGQLEAEAKALEHQWALRRERARHEAERARRQYDKVEPENRLVARTLERAWEERLREVETVEQAYEAWRRAQPGPLSESERGEVLGMAKDLERLWRGATAEERKRILRLVVSQVVLDQKRERGLVSVRIAWQTGATSEHKLRRSVQGYAECADTEVLERRVRALNGAGMMDREIATVLNAEGLLTAHGAPFTGGTVHLLRKRWDIPTVKINGVAANPQRWPDGSYSVQGAAIALGVTAQTVFKWLRKGRLQGYQRTKGQPWQITLPEDSVGVLAAQVRRTNPSRRTAS
ncbi:recombinase family protein [Falsiroseomonas sp. HC035]|uniref:recombinase family protein n=1 Tax=Falsiroseomonas sp. HC035 TaxID=3390999 RepID=UPI003D318C79